MTRLFRQFVAVCSDQWAMAQRFYKDPRTRTPILIIWVASFGGALHASVTTYFYLEVGSDPMAIGRIGFLQSMGSLLLAPLAGYALDHDLVPVMWPLLITATACSMGCLWRGMATSVMDLYVGAGLLAVGVNLWTVVLLHLSHTTPREQRSQVLSGFAVQEQGLRLLGKGVFPFWDYVVRLCLVQSAARDNGYNTTLFRYRIHMGICTIFCFFGTCALLWERRALQQSTNTGTPSLKEEEEGLKPPRTGSILVGATIDAHNISPQQIHAVRETTPSKSSSLEVALASPIPTTVTTPTTHFRYIAILSALLIQSWSSTVLVVLWPLVLRDQFHFAATEYGLVTVVASICSTSAIASFPTVEHHVGRIRTAASGATVASIACCLAFVVLPNLMHYHDHDVVEDEVETNPDAVDLDSNMAVQRSTLAGTPQSFMVHAVLAIVFEASVRTLEPSLKSILSLTVPATAQNRSLGFMSTLGGLGGMGGNLMGTWMFQRSQVWSSTPHNGGLHWLGNGTLPFAIVSFVLALASLFLWLLEWEEASQHHHHHHHHRHTEASGKVNLCEENDQAAIDGGEGMLSPSVKTANDQDGNSLFYPLMQMDTSYEMKLD